MRGSIDSTEQNIERTHESVRGLAYRKIHKLSLQISGFLQVQDPEAMTVFGYARVSTVGQTLETQIAQLVEAGCTLVVREKASGTNLVRPQLRLLCRKVTSGDVIVVTRIDRFARSARDLLNLVFTVRDQGAAFRSLAEAWDTSTPVGQLMLTVLAGIAEYEREIIRARTLEGRHLAKLNGVRFGRPPKLTSSQQASALKRLEAGESQLEVASSFSVSCSTISRVSSQARSHGGRQ